MNQRRGVIFRDSHKTTAGKVSVDDLPQFLLQTFLKSIKSIYSMRLGVDDLVLNSETMWLCSFCEACTAKCLQGIGLAKVMDLVKKHSPTSRDQVRCTEEFWTLLVTYTRFMEVF